MSNAIGNVVDVRICCKDWARISAVINTQCGISSNDRQIEKGSECFIEFTELSFVHWVCLRNILDGDGIPYDYLDLSEKRPVWRISLKDCKKS